MRTAGLKNVVDPSLATPSSSTDAQSLGNHGSKSLSPCPLTKQKWNIWVGRPGQFIVHIRDLLEIWQDRPSYLHYTEGELDAIKDALFKSQQGNGTSLQWSCPFPSCSALH